MRCKSLVLALAAGFGGVASAQPGPPPAPPPPPVDTSNTTTTEPGPPGSNPTPPPRRMQPTPVVVQEPAEASDRPEGLAIALGVGYTLPTNLSTPNTTSARLRLASGHKITELRLGTLVRFPLIARGKVDLEGLGGAQFANVKENPDGDFNTHTTNTFDILYGLGIGYWINHHWQFSMSTLNPIISYAQSKTQTGPGLSTKTSDTTIGLIFQPSVIMMLHLYN